MIAKKAEVPIVVITVTWTDAIHKRLFRGTEVELDVIPAKKVATMKTAEIGDLVKLMMNQELWRVSNVI